MTARFATTLAAWAGVALCASAQSPSLDYELPKPGVAKETPIRFVTTKAAAEWNGLKAFWNATTENGQPVVKLKVPLGLFDAPPVPAENAMTVERWELGRKLYFDPILSSDSTVSCSSCHSPKHGFTDASATSEGIGGKRGGVSAPTVANSAFNLLQFWDGRAASLEDQAQGPPQNPVEMFDGHGNAWHEAIKRIRKNDAYVKMFRDAYGVEPTRDAAAKAIAVYERTVLNGNSIHDRAELAMKVRVAEEESGAFVLQPKDYEKALKAAVGAKDWRGLDALKLDDPATIPQVAARINEGRVLFFGKARCSLCHVGQNFTDSQFHNLGVGAKDGKLSPDAFGRFDRLPLGHKNPEAIGAFKTPTLRGLVATAPYLHDGSEKTLEQVVDFYDRGGNPNAFLAAKMRDPDAEKAAANGGAAPAGRTVHRFDRGVVVPANLGLTATEKTALVAFLRSLEGEVDPLVTDPKAPIPGR